MPDWFAALSEEWLQWYKNKQIPFDIHSNVAHIIRWRRFQWGVSLFRHSRGLLEQASQICRVHTGIPTLTPVRAKVSCINLLNLQQRHFCVFVPVQLVSGYLWHLWYWVSVDELCGKNNRYYMCNNKSNCIFGATFWREGNIVQIVHVLCDWNVCDSFYKHWIRSSDFFMCATNKNFIDICLYVIVTFRTHSHVPCLKEVQQDPRASFPLPQTCIVTKLCRRIMIHFRVVL